MITLEEKKLLTDVKISILSIYEHLDHNLNLDIYKRIKQSEGLLKELEIIGEAINNLLKISSNISITYSRQIVDLRNKIIHSYDNVNDLVIWKIIIKDIPVLQNEVEHYLNINF